MATLISATVKYTPGKVISTQYGDKINAVLTLKDGSEIKLWRKPGDRRLEALSKGEVVQLLKDGEKYTFLDEEATPPSQPAPPTMPAADPNGQTWDDAHKKAIFKQMKQRAKVISVCHTQLSEQFTDPETGELLITESTLCRYAIALYQDLKHQW